MFGPWTTYGWRLNGKGIKIKKGNEKKKNKNKKKLQKWGIADYKVEKISSFFGRPFGQPNELYFAWNF